MLDHRHPGPGADDGGHGGNVDGAEAVPARPDDVEGHRIHGQRHRVLEDRVAEPDDFVDRFTLGPQSHEESRELRWSGLPQHHLFHAPRRIGDAQVLAGEEGADHVGPGLEFKHGTILSEIRGPPELVLRGRLCSNRVVIPVFERLASPVERNPVGYRP